MNLMINYHDHWWYKALTWLLIVAIIIMISIGAAPPARAIGVLTATMAAAILAVLAGAGIYTVVSSMTSAQIQDWLNDKLNEWDTSRNDGNVFSDLIQNNLITATVRGTLGIGAAAASGISNFINWLKDDLSLTNNSQITVFNTGNAVLPISSNVNGAYLAATLVNSGNTRIKLYASSLTSGLCYIAYYISNTNVYHFVAFTKDTNQNGYYWKQIENNTPNRNNINYGSVSYTEIYYQALDNQTTNNIELNSTIKGYSSLNNLLNSLNSNPAILELDTDVINIPDTTGDKVIGLEVGAFPGATTEEITEVILDGVIDNTLDVDMVVTDELVDAQEVYIINEQPLSVNTDHHAFGFQLPEITFDFSSIWHYVTDAVTYASGFISWWVNFFTSVPILTIPLYCAFTLLVVLGAMRRFLL